MNNGSYHIILILAFSDGEIDEITISTAIMRKNYILEFQHIHDGNVISPNRLPIKICTSWTVRQIILCKKPNLPTTKKETLPSTHISTKNHT